MGATSITVADNIIQGGGPAATIAGPYPNPQWAGNILFNVKDAGDMPAGGYTIVDPKLAKTSTGIYHLQPGSQAIDHAVGSYPGIKFDMDGQPRTAPLDIGADELSDSLVQAHVLNPADVGYNAK
jgi:poly(beta-D-mannuronate) lyase